MTFGKINILFADDDKDDCLFIKEALEELELTTHLTTVHNGKQRMLLLGKISNVFYNILFLDLNMPRKNGIECLEVIKRIEKVKSLPVFVFSTPHDKSVAERLNKLAAQYYISKPSSYSDLKKIIQHALTFPAKKNITQLPSKIFLA